MPDVRDARAPKRHEERFRPMQRACPRATRLALSPHATRVPGNEIATGFTPFTCYLKRLRRSFRIFLDRKSRAPLGINSSKSGKIVPGRKKESLTGNEKKRTGSEKKRYTLWTSLLPRWEFWYNRNIRRRPEPRERGRSSPCRHTRIGNGRGCRFFFDFVFGRSRTGIHPHAGLRFLDYFDHLRPLCQES